MIHVNISTGLVHIKLYPIMLTSVKTEVSIANVRVFMNVVMGLIINVIIRAINDTGTHNRHIDPR